MMASRLACFSVEQEVTRDVDGPAFGVSGGEAGVPLLLFLARVLTVFIIEALFDSSSGNARSSILFLFAEADLSNSGTRCSELPMKSGSSS